MGHIVYWTIIRIAILIPVLWLLYGFMEYRYWWVLGIMSVYGVVIHPAVIQYKIFLEKNREILTNTLCASCSHFDETAVICLKYDEHPTEEYLPCDGMDWEPKANTKTEKDEF